jgi:cell division protease FtsH
MIWNTSEQAADKGLPYRSKFTHALLTDHFAPLTIDEIRVSERRFPFRVRADLQRAIDRLFVEGTSVSYSCGVQREYPSELSFSILLIEGHCPCLAVPPEHEEVDIGENEPVKCVKNSLWLLEQDGVEYAVLLTPALEFHQATGVLFQIATPKSQEGTEIAERFFKHLEESVLKSESYRGKVLSLEKAPHSYTGASTGITVHRLHTVTKDQVILPKKTRDLLERNVIHFVEQREKLAKYGQPTKKGILFYGPPGTGKTHTLHYLAGKLKGHTTLLISAEQVGLLAEYMTLARLLQPSIVVIEDADLIARERTQMGGPCEEILLNKLLNEMDGLKEQADILFILTTNRPESLEAALTARPGRIDQAIEFPLPDDEGREKLVRLYSQGAELTDETIQAIVKRTERVSPAFIKELMRRSLQFHLERDGDGRIELSDVENALEEMLFSGGSLNLKLLGAEGITRDE